MQGQGIMHLHHSNGGTAAASHVHIPGLLFIHMTIVYALSQTQIKTILMQAAAPLASERVLLEM